MLLELLIGYGTAHADLSTVTAARIMLHSVSIDLPGRDRAFPDAAAMDLVTNNGTACHAAGVVLIQPPPPQP